MRLKGKLAVITAAASGMGRAASLLFAREGASVCVVDYNEKAAIAVVEEIKAAGGIAHAVRADLSDPEAARDMVHHCAKQLGGIDIIWNHAGEPGPGGIEGIDLRAYQHAMDLNVTSSIVACGEVVSYMRKRGGGAILLTASVSGLVGSQFSPIYSAAKFGIVGLGKSLALALAQDKIRVNVICPGLTRTPMLAGFMGRGVSAEQAKANEERFIASIPLGRTAEPIDIANAALWLASDEASYVTGVALPVDGGFTSR